MEKRTAFSARGFRQRGASRSPWSPTGEEKYAPVRQVVRVTKGFCVISCPFN